MFAHKYIKGFHRKRIMLFLLWIPLAPMNGAAQIAINSTNQAADASAIVDVSSTTKGFLPPRMTTDQRKAIASPAEGLVVYNTDHQAIEVFNGEVWTTNTGQFKCGNTQIKDSENNRYETVLIGTQCWMAENLNIGTRIDASVDQSKNPTIEKYCYDNDDANCKDYGGLYQWNEMMQYITTEGTQGICPTGWHLPTNAEWITLTTLLGGLPDAGGKMKETGTDHWKEPNTGATNSSGFRGFGGGYVVSHVFSYLKECGAFWTSSGETGGVAYNYDIRYDSAAVFSGSNYINMATSVRCIKD